MKVKFRGKFKPAPKVNDIVVRKKEWVLGVATGAFLFLAKRVVKRGVPRLLPSQYVYLVEYGYQVDDCWFTFSMWTKLEDIEKVGEL